MKVKPRSEVVSKNNYRRFPALYRCYCPKCGKLLKQKDEMCECGQKIDWSEWK